RLDAHRFELGPDRGNGRPEAFRILLARDDANAEGACGLEEDARVLDQRGQRVLRHRRGELVLDVDDHDDRRLRIESFHRYLLLTRSRGRKVESSAGSSMRGSKWRIARPISRSASSYRLAAMVVSESTTLWKKKSRCPRRWYVRASSPANVSA